MTQASREFQVFVKPLGSLCNLACRYCYYLKTAALYPEAEMLRMPDDLLESYIAEHIAACPTSTILFSWHGGEPTLLGVDFYRKVVALQRKHAPTGRRILNGIQTNGMLLDEAWCRFLRAEGFAVGLSLDGPQALHDAYRVTRGGGPTHERVMRSWRLLQRYGIPCDVLCVVHDRNVRQPEAVYGFFREIGADFVQFLPLVERGENGNVTPESVPALAYGEFLCAVFREWMAHDMRRIGVQLFEEAMRPLVGLEHAMCHYRPTCGDAPVLEHNGDVYVCDHYVNPEHLVGNLRQRPLVEMLENDMQRRFGQQKWDALPRHCRACEVLDMCNGGCPKDRLLRTPDGEEGLNYLCAGLKLFFTTTRPHLERLAALRRPGQVVRRIMDLLPVQEAQAGARVGRNDPCPCGSGKKYKHCCMRKLGAGR
ncbi:MAG: anaerobic sulfatase maturase [Anaerolineae bacterium]|nr:anaerobic sulfatase maturase [Anaerolineae bacterium]